MRVHLYIFVSYLLAYIIFIVNATLESFVNPYVDDTPSDVQNYCRYKITDQFFFMICQVMSLLMLILFIYLSVNFSIPLSDDYRTKFLLLFQKNDLDVVKQARENFNRNESHEAKVKRYNASAIRDAELIIIRALTSA